MPGDHRAEVSSARRRALLIGGWLVALGAHDWLCTWLTLDLNMLAWRPHWGWEESLLGLGILAILAGVRFLVVATTDRAAKIVAVVLCLVLVGFGATVLPAEPANPYSWGRTKPSPAWFRIGVFLLFSLPAGCWLWPGRRRVEVRPIPAEKPPGSAA